MSKNDPVWMDRYEAGTRRAIAFAIAAVFAGTVVLVFVTFWIWDSASENALAVLSAVIGVLGAVTGYYFATGD